MRLRWTPSSKNQQFSNCVYHFMIGSTKSDCNPHIKMYAQFPPFRAKVGQTRGLDLIKCEIPHSPQANFHCKSPPLSCISTCRWWSILHFAFVVTWCFSWRRKKTSVCVNIAYSLSVDIWTSVYAVCHHAKLCLIHGHFQHRMYAHFLTFFCKVLMLASFAESLHFVSLDQCSQGTAWLKTTTPDEDVSQGTRHIIIQ